VRNHIVAADLRAILDLLERILRVSSPVILEKLLDSRGLVLVLHVFATKQAYRAELIAYNEGLAVAGEFAIKWVVTDVPIDRVDTVLAETLDDLLPLYVPEYERATVTASHEQLLKYWVWSQDPRVFLELVTTRPGQVIIESLVDCVPDLDPADLLLEFLCLRRVDFIPGVFNLTRD